MQKKKESKIVNAIRGYISKVVPKPKGDDRQGFKNQENNVVYLKLPLSEVPGKKLYAERKYRTWDCTELNLICDKIDTAIVNDTDVNITELKELMPYRSISSIRCKVLWLIYLTTSENIGTYTVQIKDKKEIKK